MMQTSITTMMKMLAIRETFKVNLSDRIIYALWFSFSLMYSNTQFRTKHILNLGLRQ